MPELCDGYVDPLDLPFLRLGELIVAKSDKRVRRILCGQPRILTAPPDVSIFHDDGIGPEPRLTTGDEGLRTIHTS
jgi:hypothetical protein